MHNMEFLDVAETARRLGVSLSFLNKARLTGDGPPYAKFSKAVRYDWRKVQEWAETRMCRSTSDYVPARPASSLTHP